MSTPTKSKASQPLQKTSTIIKDVALFTKLGKSLFDPNTQFSLSPGQITSILQACGLKIPKNVMITAQSAQLIISGGTLCSSLSTGAECGSIVAGESAAFVAAATMLLQSIGLISADTAQQIRMGTEIIMIASSGGENILADLAYVIDLTMMAANDLSNEAREREGKRLIQMSVNDAINLYNQREKAQSRASANLFSDYQNKKISVFEMVGGIATQAPDLFLNFYPEYAVFLPPVTQAVWATHSAYTVKGAYDYLRFPYYLNIFAARGEAAIGYRPGDCLNWYGDWPVGIDDLSHAKKGGLSYIANPKIFPRFSTDAYSDEQLELSFPGETGKFTVVQSYSSFVAFKTIVSSKSIMQQTFYDKFINYPIEPYSLMSAYCKNQNLLRQYGFPKNAQKLGVFDHNRPVYPRMDPWDVATLSLFPPYFNFLDDNFDVAKILSSLMLTPTDIGYGDDVQKEYLRGDLMGEEVSPPPPITFNGVDYFTVNQRIAKRQVDSDNLKAKISMQADLDGDSFTFYKDKRARQIVTELGIMPFIPDSELEKTNYYRTSTDKKGYRNIQNMISVLTMLEFMEKDSYFKDANGMQIDNTTRTMLGATKASVEEKHRYWQFLSITRGLNQKAKQKVAGLYGKNLNQVKVIPAKNEKDLAKVVPL